MRRLLVALSAIALATATLTVPATVAQAGPASRAPLAGRTPSWATPGNDRGHDDPARRVGVRVYLALHDRAGALAAVPATTDPTSPTYGRYLTADQFRAAYSPRTADVAAVRAWLTGAGLHVGYVPANRFYVSADGTVAQLEAVFGTRLDRYAIDGHVLRAPSATPSVPASLAGVVDGVVGLDEAAHLARPSHVGAGDEVAPAAAPGSAATPRAQGTNAPSAPPSPGFRNARPCSLFFGQQLDTTDSPYGHGYPSPTPYAPCGYTPAQLRAAYGIESSVAAGVDGRGQTVAIVDAFASPTIFHDAQTYASRVDPGRPLRRQQFRQIVPPGIFNVPADDPCDPQGWYGEETLDVESAHGMAPGANILYVGGGDCFDPALDAALLHVVDQHLASIVSNSYGDLGEGVDPNSVVAFDDISLEAALTGVGLYFSSGDDGDDTDTFPQPATDFPASSSLVTAVGGTSLAVDKNGHAAFEQGWETGKSTLTAGKWQPPAPGAFLYGSGGGTSRLYSEPFYQRGVVPDRLVTRWGGRGRVVPDIALVGDPSTGFLVGQTQTFSDGVYWDTYRLGGTSLSSPLFAGVMALADQKAGRPHGFANPLLYRLAGSGALRDIVAGPKQAVVRLDFVNGENANDGFSVSTRTIAFPRLSIHVAPGYDDVTGLGVPNGARFLASLGRTG